MVRKDQPVKSVSTKKHTDDEPMKVPPDPEEPLLPEEDPDIVLEEDPFETPPPFEPPEPGEGP